MSTSPHTYDASKHGPRKGVSAAVRGFPIPGGPVCDVILVCPTTDALKGFMEMLGEKLDESKVKKATVAADE